jgi:pyridoxal phosphate enzyme (YggS family)
MDRKICYEMSLNEDTMGIKENVHMVISELPEYITLIGATKTRSPEEILEAVAAGLAVIGENYAQEAEEKARILKDRVRYHFIGHLQRNKVKKIVGFIDMVETLDSVRLAEEIDKRCRTIGKVMPVLIEINSGREPQKAGVLPEDAEALIRKIAKFSHVKIVGLMTMGPMSGDPEEARPFFIETRKVFENIMALGIPGVEMKYLSMGMSNSYRIAIEEGANMVRIGTRLFGERTY